MSKEIGFFAEVVAETGRDRAGEPELRWRNENGVKSLHGSMLIIAADMSDLPDEFHDAASLCLIDRGELAVMRAEAECAKENGDHWRFNLSTSNVQNSQLRAEIRGLKKDLERSRTDVKARDEDVKRLEQLRPIWAQGFSSDSIAAQTSFSALNEIWGKLRANDQTSAIKRLDEWKERSNNLIDENNQIHANMTFLFSDLGVEDYTSARSVAASLRTEIADLTEKLASLHAYIDGAELSQAVDHDRDISNRVEEARPRFEDFMSRVVFPANYSDKKFARDPLDDGYIDRYVHQCWISYLFALGLVN